MFIDERPDPITSTREETSIGARRLYGANYDFPIRCDRPRTEYMLATLPRSGSTYFAMELWRTGVMGSPMEYLNPVFANLIGQRLRILGMEDELLQYWQAVTQHRTSPNGVFGYKMFVGYFTKFGAKYRGMLSRITPAKVIYLTRADLIAQAVSYSRAVRSGAWFHSVPEREHPEYDQAHILQCVDSIGFQLDFWHELFAVTGAQVHCVTYEDLLERPKSVIVGVANFLGVELDSSAIVRLPRISIQRDATSADWVDRVRRDVMDVPTTRACTKAADLV